MRLNPGDQLQRPHRAGGRGQRDYRRSPDRRAAFPIWTIDEKMISRRLYTADLPEPDLLIRTSGEMRVSNFLLLADRVCGAITSPIRSGPDFNRAELLRAGIPRFPRSASADSGGLSGAAREIETDAPDGGAGYGGDRRLLAMSRVVTALFLVSHCRFYSALFAPWWWLFFAVVAIVALLSMREYARITGVVRAARIWRGDSDPSSRLHARRFC